MDKYEYCFLTVVFSPLSGGIYQITPKGKRVKLGGRNDAFGSEKSSIFLNQLGNHGWEVSGATVDRIWSTTTSRWTLKRKIGEAELTPEEL